MMEFTAPKTLQDYDMNRPSLFPEWDWRWLFDTFPRLFHIIKSE
jgi:hypothetical protein